jgi:hypothetical protein
MGAKVQKRCEKRKVKRELFAYPLHFLFLFHNSLVVWEIGRLVVWEIGRLVVWEIGRLVVWEIGRLVVWEFFFARTTGLKDFFFIDH